MFSVPDPQEDANDTVRRSLGTVAPAPRSAAPFPGLVPAAPAGRDLGAPALDPFPLGRPDYQAPPYARGSAQVLSLEGLRGPLDDLAAAIDQGGGSPSRADVLSPAARRADAFVDGAFDAAALNPLVGVASPLLWLAARLIESAAPEDVRAFRDRILDEIRRFEAAAMAQGIPKRSVLVARYALCATIDDIILNTAWAGQVQWGTRSLVSVLYGETWGGERAFELLQQLAHAPDENIDALELMAICLSIGFVGKYRVMEDGHNQLNRLRAELYRIIRRVRGSFERDLAPAWHGVTAPYRPPPSTLRYWMPVLVAALLLASFYLALRLSLANRIDVALQKIAALVSPAPIAVQQPAIPPPPRTVGPLTQVQRISALLQRDIAERRVEVVGSPRTVVVRLPASTFPTAAASLPPSETPLVERIGAALNREPGGILVTGHTDNVRIVATGPTSGNVELSRARASSVAATLKPFLTDPGRVEIVGRGEEDPLASNATVEGRARNRRVEIQIPAEETLPGRTAPPSAAPPSVTGSPPERP